MPVGKGDVTNYPRFIEEAVLNEMPIILRRGLREQFDGFFKREVARLSPLHSAATCFD